jgi:hypothetical protein
MNGSCLAIMDQTCMLLLALSGPNPDKIHHEPCTPEALRATIFVSSLSLNTNMGTAPEEVTIIGAGLVVCEHISIATTIFHPN